MVTLEMKSGIVHVYRTRINLSLIKISVMSSLLNTIYYTYVYSYNSKAVYTVLNCTQEYSLYSSVLCRVRSGRIHLPGYLTLKVTGI